MHAEAGVDDEVFRALADPTRRALLDALNSRGGQSLGELCSGLDMARQSVSKHLAVLEGANLVTTLRRGREKLHFLNAEPIQAINDRWINQFHAECIQALGDLKSALEQTAMSNEFIYTSYINSTQERVWQALTDPAFMKKYWGTTFDTDWKVGSEMVWNYDGVSTADPAQKVVTFEPHTSLAYTWQTISPEFAKKVGFTEELTAQLNAERRSTVRFELEQAGDKVRLTVVHTGFEPGSAMLDSISGGWPMVISSLKTLLETGESVPATSVKR
jgi:DNA-binding transcriptional ArsR family regulator/uncharacterized protein YndB with AHSA1/START domain